MRNLFTEASSQLIIKKGIGKDNCSAPITAEFILIKIMNNKCGFFYDKGQPLTPPLPYFFMN